MRWLELFAGAGGAALGIKAAGGEAVACVEWDADACATLAAAGFPAVHLDVREYIARYSFKLAPNMPPHTIEAMWASFPCQCWSSAGKRLGAMDPRNGWPWTVDALDKVRPQWLVAENVVGLTQHSGEHCGDPMRCPACYLEAVILPELRSRFAHVALWKLDAADFGVPQHRRRIFLVAGPYAVIPPAPTHVHPAQCLGLFSTLKPWVTFGEVLGLVCEDLGADSHKPQSQRTLRPGRPAPTLDCGATRDSYRAPMVHVIGGGRNASDGTRSYRDLTSEPSTTVAAVQVGNAGPWVCDKATAESLLDRPSVTVTTTEVKGSRQGHGSGGAGNMGRASDQLWRSTGRRRLTTAECATLQDFPPDHPWQGTKTSVYQQIGNAVPPRLAAAVAGAVSKAAR